VAQHHSVFYSPAPDGAGLGKQKFPRGGIFVLVICRILEVCVLTSTPGNKLVCPLLAQKGVQ